MMTDSAVKTPEKRKTGEGLPQSGKKQKLNGVPKTSQVSPNKGFPQKKLIPFAGTGKLEGKERAKTPKQNKAGAQQEEPTQNKADIPQQNEKREKKHKGQYYNLIKQIKEGTAQSKHDAIKIIEEKIKTIEDRDVKTKTAEKKLKILKRIKNFAAGNSPGTPDTKAKGDKNKNVSKSKSRRERRKQSQLASEGGPENKKSVVAAKTKGKQAVVKAEDSSDESDDSEEPETKPKGKVQKVVAQVEEDEDDSDEEESGEEEDDGEEESGDEEHDDEDAEGEDDDEGSDEEESEEEPAPKPKQVGKGKPLKKKA